VDAGGNWARSGGVSRTFVTRSGRPVFTGRCLSFCGTRRSMRGITSIIRRLWNRADPRSSGMSLGLRTAAGSAAPSLWMGAERRFFRAVSGVRQVLGRRRCCRCHAGERAGQDVVTYADGTNGYADVPVKRADAAVFGAVIRSRTIRQGRMERGRMRRLRCGDECRSVFHSDRSEAGREGAVSGDGSTTTI